MASRASLREARALVVTHRVVPFAPEHHMRGLLRRNRPQAFITQSTLIEALEQSLTPAGPATSRCVTRRSSPHEDIAGSRSTSDGGRCSVDLISCIVRMRFFILSSARKCVRIRGDARLSRGKAFVVRILDFEVGHLGVISISSAVSPHRSASLIDGYAPVEAGW